MKKAGGWRRSGNRRHDSAVFKKYKELWAESGRDAMPNNSAGCEGHTFR